ncbi:MAG TPA: DUF3298 and DUF4163 domain-containing protein [Pyrinomonadaceae bacterium]|nr:DUF3298 and DUF4163 domain-containing protein [Pyrinomonadaceae bacterium]
MLKRFLICLLLFVPISCKRTPPSATSQPPATTQSPQAQLDHVSGGAAPLDTKYFKGSIGTSLDLQMKLVRSGDQLTGSYFYQRIGTKIDLRGTVDKDGNVSLEEFDPSGKQTGIFKGLWQIDAATGMVSIAGNWSKPLNDKNADKKTAFSIHEEPISLTGDAELVTKQIKESNKKLMYEIAVQYPQLSGSANPNFEKFNQAVRGSINKKVAAFKKEVAPQPDDEPRPEGSMGSDLSVSYTVELAQDDLVSVDFSMSSYYQGAAHPNAFSEAINFDLKNGKQLKLSDLFKPGAKYLAAISAYCVADLKKQSKAKDNMLDDSTIQSGAGPTAKNYESWSITKRGIGINFDPYQVGPYAAGPQYVLVPYSALKEMINPDGPVGQFAK